MNIHLLGMANVNVRVGGGNWHVRGNLNDHCDTVSIVGYGVDRISVETYFFSKLA